MNSNDLTRRAALGLGGTLALALAAGPAAALTEDEAAALIQKVVDETMAVVESDTSMDQALREFEQILSKYGDIPIVARAVLGQPWRTASEAQRRAFTDAFRGYVARKYGREFREYRGASMKVVGAQDQGNKGVLVQTIVDYPGEAPFPVDWQVSDASGSPKLFNLFIEGISMLSSERSEVRAILESNGGNLDATIRDLRSRG